MKQSGIPEEYSFRGLGPVELTVPYAEPTLRVLTDVLGFTEIGKETHEDRGTVTVLESGNGGARTEVHLIERNDLPRERPGKGSVHHVSASRMKRSLLYGTASLRKKVSATQAL